MILKFIQGGYDKVKGALGKTRQKLQTSLASLFSRSSLDPDSFEELEEAFYTADFGIELSQKLSQVVEEYYKKNKKASKEDLKKALMDAILSDIPTENNELCFAETGKCSVFFIIGSNGNGKTTSIAKLAKRLKEEGKKVLIAAADTFRAAAQEQLSIWAQRLELELIKGQMGSDPSALIFDAMQAAKARSADVLLIDTAGRLHNKSELMKELEKMRRVCKKFDSQAPHETLLVIDACNGQNALEQAKSFHISCPLSGFILTKMDGSTKGGIALPLQKSLDLPIKFLGTGEGFNDLLPYEHEKFIQALLDIEDSEDRKP